MIVQLLVLEVLLVQLFLTIIQQFLSQKVILLEGQMILELGKLMT
jgi:hypothetical protein